MEKEKPRNASVTYLFLRYADQTRIRNLTCIQINYIGLKLEKLFREKIGNSGKEIPKRKKNTQLQDWKPGCFCQSLTLFF